MAGEDYGLTSVNDVRSGKPHDAEKQRLAEIIDWLNDLYGAEVSDDKLHFASGIVDRIERDAAVMAQVRNHSGDQVMHGLFPKKVTDAMLDALSDHEKIRMPFLEDEETGRQFALVIRKLLAGRSSNARVLCSELRKRPNMADNDLERIVRGRPHVRSRVLCSKRGYWCYIAEPYLMTSNFNKLMAYHYAQ